MGSASNGPLVADAQGVNPNATPPVQLLDLATLKPGDLSFGAGKLLYLALNQVTEGNRSHLQASVHLDRESRPLLTLPRLNGLDGLVDWLSGRTQAFDRHVHLIPDAKALVILPATADKLIVHRFDLDRLLEKSGVDYLFVTSRPPTNATPGAAFAYTVSVKSKKGGVRMKLESGPEGMKLTPDGKLTWEVPADFTGTDRIIISVADAAGQEIFHTFELKPAGR